MKDIEKRFQTSEFRATEGKEMTVGGYAAMFNRSTVIETFLGSFEEEIAPGAFAKSIKEGDVRALWSHDTSIVIGRTKNGSLNLWEDDTGLRFELKLANTQAGRDAYELIRGGYVSGVSFGFRVKSDQWTEGEKGQNDKRKLLDVELFEVSPVAYPAYESTSVSARSSGEEALKEYQVRRAFEKKEQEETLSKLRASLEVKELKQSLLKKALFRYIH